MVIVKIVGTRRFMILQHNSYLTLNWKIYEAINDCIDEIKKTYKFPNVFLVFILLII